MKEKILLVGGGGHCKACIDVIEQEGTYQIAGIVDVPENLHCKIMEYKIIATDGDLPQLVNEHENFLITIGQIKSPQQRVKLFETLKDLGAKLPPIISPLAYVSEKARVAEGTIVMHHALINADARVGKNCIINSKALIEHDAVIGDHCHISTGALINGGTTVSRKSFVGSNSIIKEYVEIGEETVIGAGVHVLQNVSPKSLLK